MHGFVYTFFIALTNNLDNIGVRVAYSIRGIKISSTINVWISVITFVISLLAAWLGSSLSLVLGTRWCSVLAMFLLSAIGLWMILEPVLKSKNQGNSDSNGESRTSLIHVLFNPEKADMDRSKHIDFKEASLLGLALSINNVGGGVSAGLIGLSPFWVGLMSAILSFLALWMGNYIAEAFIRWNVTHKATVLAGLVLIAIGIGQVLK